MRTSIKLPISVCRDLKTIVQKSLELCGNNLDQVVLFGSFATDKYQPDSDYDICLVLDKVPSSNKDKQTLRDLADYCDIDKDVEVVICSRTELETGHMVYKYIRMDGVILYG